MKLTRRDAIAALAAGGVAVGGGGAVLLSVDDGATDPDDDGTAPSLTEHDVTTLVAAGEVLYPTAIENVGRFVTRYARGRADDRPDVGDGMAEAVAYLDDYADAWYDDRFAALDPSTRGEALRGMNADTADPDPAGTDVERVRHYVVNELLFALYTTPTGGRLVGIENPQGHPGGLVSYQRGPRS